MSPLDAFVFFGGLIALVIVVIIGETGATPVFRRRK